MHTFNVYSDQLKGTHSFLSPSNYHWVNYDIEKLRSTFKKRQAQERGTKLHSLAEQCITLNVPLPKTKSPINMFVNDAIGYKMKTEQLLYYSDYSFGTADAISFKDKILRIHDLKTGESPTSMKQLEIYAAYFCLEYSVKPEKINMELRIYQSGEILIHIPNPSEILKIMDKVILFNKEIQKMITEQEE